MPPPCCGTSYDPPRPALLSLTFRFYFFAPHNPNHLPFPIIYLLIDYTYLDLKFSVRPTALHLVITSLCTLYLLACP